MAPGVMAIEELERSILVPEVIILAAGVEVPASVSEANISSISP